MQTIPLGTSTLEVSRLAYGAWRLANAGAADGRATEPGAAGRQALLAAYEAGYTLFDHADIYGGGEAERIHGNLLAEQPDLLQRTILATKCGVRKKGDPAGSSYRYDLGRDYILRSAEESLRRLRVDRIDLYQLHRADWLLHPHEVAEAFDQLRQAGKVRFFGVSNFRPSLVTAVQAACSAPILVNQVEISLGKLDVFEDGTLDQCLIEKITPMAWSPLGGGQYADGVKRVLPYQEGYRTDGVLSWLDRYAAQYEVSRSAIALAWLMKHPAGIIPIVGSTNPQRIQDAVCATRVHLSREEWYHLLEAARGGPLP